MKTEFSRIIISCNGIQDLEKNVNCVCFQKVEVEALAIQGPKMDTVMSQVKKLEVSVLVLGQKPPSPLLNWSVH